MNTKSPKNSKRGFTLLEVIVALAILAMSLTAILQFFGGSLLLSRRAEMVTYATMLARQKMAEQMIKIEKDTLEGKFPSTDQESEGNFDAPYEDFKWHVKIRKVEVPMPPQQEQNAASGIMQMLSKQIGDSLREIKMTVSWNELGETQDITVTTHVIKK